MSGVREERKDGVHLRRNAHVAFPICRRAGIHVVDRAGVADGSAGKFGREAGEKSRGHAQSREAFVSECQVQRVIRLDVPGSGSGDGQSFRVDCRRESARPGRQSKLWREPGRQRRQ